MRLLLVVNSFASSVTARNTVVVHRALSQGHDVEVVETNRRGHATRIAQDAARRGIDLVVGFGGDGTLNEVATGIAGTDTVLGVLPGGSTNVFARTLGMPNDPVVAVQSLVAGLDTQDFRPIGLGRVNGRYFCFHTGIGYDAAVVKAVEKRASLKRWASRDAMGGILNNFIDRMETPDANTFRLVLKEPCGIVLDVRTGEVIAMVSLPDYDANQFGRSSNDERLNRGTFGRYEPGSTFKLQDAALALDSGTVQIWNGFDASGPIHVGRFTISDFAARLR